MELARSSETATVPVPVPDATSTTSRAPFGTEDGTGTSTSPHDRSPTPPLMLHPGRLQAMELRQKYHLAISENTQYLAGNTCL